MISFLAGGGCIDSRVVSFLSTGIRVVNEPDGWATTSDTGSFATTPPLEATTRGGEGMVSRSQEPMLQPKHESLKYQHVWSSPSQSLGDPAQSGKRGTRLCELAPGARV